MARTLRLPLKTLSHAVRLRAHIIRQLELADVEASAAGRRRRLTVVVAGGGFAGAELVAEIRDMAHGLRRYFPQLDPAEFRFVLVHAQDRILPELQPRLAALALRRLRAKGIEVRLAVRVAEDTQERVTLDDDTVFDTATVVWTAGNSPNPLVRRLGFDLTHGGLACEPTMLVRGQERVWALGDCASVPDPAAPDRYYPPTAQHAVREGAAVGALSSWLSGLGRLLLADPADRADDESLGARTLRAVVRGATGGIAGGLIFTVIMVQIGFLGTVARLVGSASPGVGLAVHLIISVILGSTYGLFFRRQSDDLTSGIGWGVSWGFLWWLVGALTVLPVWLGGDPQWSAADAVAAFPSLIGHLGFGAALGATFHALEARHDPWWLRHSMPTSAQARVLDQTRRAAAAAPAVWALNALIAVTVTVFLDR